MFAFFFVSLLGNCFLCALLSEKIVKFWYTEKYLNKNEEKSLLHSLSGGYASSEFPLATDRFY